MITSTSNARIKRLVNLKKKRKLRDEEGVFLVEGIRMFREVPLDKLKEVYVSESFYKKEKDTVKEVLKDSKIRVEELTDTVFSHASDTKTPQGILCVVEQMNHKISELTSAECPLIMVLDHLQDPGNLGTILRMGEGAGVTGVVMSSNTVDIYNPKTIRSTMGSIFRVPFVYVQDFIDRELAPESEVQDFSDAVSQCQNAGIKVYAAHLGGKNTYLGEDYREGTAFLIGNEGNGLTDDITKQADTLIRIPMQGEVESLNAAIACTILTYEAVRQRSV